MPIRKSYPYYRLIGQGKGGFLTNVSQQKNFLDSQIECRPPRLLLILSLYIHIECMGMQDLM